MIEIINIKEANKWDKIVKQFENYSVFYLSTYANAFYVNNKEEGEPFLFYYEENRTKAINVFFKRDIANCEVLKDKIEKNKFFDIISPYGYGGFLVEGEDTENVFKKFNYFCIEQNIICEFVRFNLFNKIENKYPGAIEAKLHNVVRSTQIDIEEMLYDFEHKVRKNIKKANSNELKIEVDTKGETLETFLEIYYETMKRNDANQNFYFKKEFFETLNKMDNKVYFNVIYDGKIISTELVIFDSKVCYSFLGGTLSEYFNVRPNDFLKFEIIKWAKEKGISDFVLGGGYGKDDGIFQYKKSFAPSGVVDFFVGHQIYNEKIYNDLIQIRKKESGFDENTDYFPIYRKVILK